jgi:hypothetical protein
LPSFPWHSNNLDKSPLLAISSRLLCGFAETFVANHRSLHFLLASVVLVSFIIGMFKDIHLSLDILKYGFGGWIGFFVLVVVLFVIYNILRFIVKDITHVRQGLPLAFKEGIKSGRQSAAAAKKWNKEVKERKAQEKLSKKQASTLPVPS